MLLLAVTSALLSTPAFAKPKVIAVPGLGLEVTLPEPPEGQMSQWGHTLGDATTEVRLSLRNAGLYTDVTFEGTSWQPILSEVKELPQLVLPMDDEDLGITLGETTKVEVEGIGEVTFITADVQDTWMERELWTRVAVFPIAGAAAVVSATSSESAERATEVLDLVLADMIKVTDPPLPVEELPAGLVELEAGYTVQLPAGWRALTEAETRSLDSARVGGEGEFSGAFARLFVVDTSSLTKNIFQCTVDSTGTLEILAPEKSQRAIDNFKASARVKLKGGRYRLQNGTKETFIDVYSEVPVVPEEEGELKFLSLGDREGYLWRVKGENYGEPVSASLFYTTYGSLGLTCIAVADEGEESILNTFDQAVASVRVPNGELHPMPLSSRARYIRWWPYTHPAMQLYWLPLPLFMIAGWLVLKD